MRPNHKVLTRAVGLVAALTLVACSGGDKIVAPGTTGGTVKLNSADSTYLVQQVAGAAFSSIKALRTITTQVVTGLGSAAPSCTATSNVGNTDANSNGIVDDRTVTYATGTCSTVSNGVTTATSGSIRIQDLNGIYGYRITYTNWNVVATKGDSTTRFTLNGTQEFAWVSATSARTLDNTSLFVQTQSSLGSVSLTRVANLTGAFTPSGTGTIALNRALPTGTLSLDGTLTMTFNVTGNQVVAGSAPTQTVNMSVATVTPLTASTTCTSDAAFDAGKMQTSITGSQTGTAVAVFVGCGSGGGGTVTNPQNPSGGGKK